MNKAIAILTVGHSRGKILERSEARQTPPEACLGYENVIQCHEITRSRSACSTPKTHIEQAAVLQQQLKRHIDHSIIAENADTSESTI
ncbi:MAG: hypothetical protein GX939_03510 [Clostridiaceae bacterium]|nr:hypothetical protein [Clostridiaceae bacterium]